MFFQLENNRINDQDNAIGPDEDEENVSCSNYLLSEPN